jgi:hypothetical protein
MRIAIRKVLWCGLLLVSLSPVTTVYAQHNPERGERGMNFERRRAAGAERPETFALAPARPFPNFDARRSLFVTDLKATSQLSFAEVISQLAQGGHTKISKERLFAQWWSSENFGGPTHCDAEGAPGPNGFATGNGYPLRCPRSEWEQPNPFLAETAVPGPNGFGYTAIAYVNRFDQAKADGSDCGEYRIIFARNSGVSFTTAPPPTVTNRNLIIFEARVPNPRPNKNTKAHPEANHDGCHGIQEFWLSLSDPKLSTSDIGKKLKAFYLKGDLDGHGYNIPPVVSVKNYSRALGQIRSNQFMLQPLVPAVDSNGTNPPAAGSPPDFEWTLRQFNTDVSTRFARIIPAPVATNPAAELFNPKPGDPRADALASVIVEQLPNLRGLNSLTGTVDEHSITLFTFDMADVPAGTNVHLDTLESNEFVSTFGDVLHVFQQGGAANPLRKKIQEGLTKAGSTLTPDNIVARIRTQTCAGCHHYSNDGTGNAPNTGTELGLGTDPANVPPEKALFTWQSALKPRFPAPFTQVREFEFEVGTTAGALDYQGPDGLNSRWKISDVLRSPAFLPSRQAGMLDFLGRFKP